MKKSTNHDTRLVPLTTIISYSILFYYIILYYITRMLIVNK